MGFISQTLYRNETYKARKLKPEIQAEVRADIGKHADCPYIGASLVPISCGASLLQNSCGASFGIWPEQDRDVTQTVAVLHSAVPSASTTPEYTLDYPGETI